MRRRQFITLIGGAAAAWPISARGQEPRKRPLIGRLSTGSRDVSPVSRYIERFLAGMRELGYVEGRDFDMTYAMADFHADRLPQVTAELVKLAPDVILAGELSKPLPPEKPLPRFRLLSLRLPMRLRSASLRATPGLAAMSRE
jgi:putative tryptophan/tyrosine transport system substrate-binding protein